MRAAATALAVCAVVLVAGCGSGDERGDALKGGSITIAQPRPPASLDPAVANDEDARQALWLVYTPPVTYRHAEGRDGMTLVPGLAEALPRASPDGSSYSFTFRPGLRYSNGQPLRASDFAHTLARARALNPRARAVFARVRRVEANDRARLVTVTLARPDPSFPAALATTWAGLVPRTTPIADRSRTPPPGIGSYRIARVRPDGSFVLVRRRAFQLPGVPNANLDRIAVRTVASPERAARAVIDGSIDYTETGLPPAMLPEIRSSYVDRYREHRTLTLLYAFMGQRRGPFRDEAVRRAVAYALDISHLRPLADGFMQGGCALVPSLLPATLPPGRCPYGDRQNDSDLVKARALVEGSGHGGARVVVLGGTDRRGRRLARAYARTLIKIGLRARIRLVVPGRLARAAARPGAVTGLTTFTPVLPVPAAYFELVDGRLAGSPNLGGVRHAELTAGLRTAAEEPDARTAAKAFAALDREVVGRAYVAPFGFTTAGLFVSARLDAENCATFQPVFGADWSSFCLR